MFFRTPFLLPLFYPSLTWRILTDQKIIYLTFDDGPVPGPTEFVLDTLSNFEVKATFFCIGDNVSKHPHLFKRIVADGHAVGNHTYNHVKGWAHSTSYYLDNVKQCDEQLKVSGYCFNKQQLLFRPPYGRITLKQIKALGDYKIIMWDVLTSDYDPHLSSEKCLKGSIAATRTGSVVVFHDSLKAEHTMSYVLPRFIEHFRKEGFTFDVIPQPLIPKS